MTPNTTLTYTRLFLSTLVFVLILSSCEDERRYKLSHFATAFVTGHDISVSFIGDSTTITMRRSNNQEKNVSVFDNDKAAVKQYNEIASQVGDNCHSEVITIEMRPYYDPQISRTFSASLIKNISITSDIAWGETLPIGAELNGDFIIAMMVFDKYIQTCQKPNKFAPIPKELKITTPEMLNYVNTLYNQTDSYGEPLVDRLSNVNFESIKYWGYSALHIYPEMKLNTNHPSLKNKQTLTIKVTYQDGKEVNKVLQIK